MRSRRHITYCLSALEFRTFISNLYSNLDVNINADVTTQAQSWPMCIWHTGLRNTRAEPQGASTRRDFLRFTLPGVTSLQTDTSDYLNILTREPHEFRMNSKSKDLKETMLGLLKPHESCTSC
ncbi:hypothetical protein NPIL_122001 [Nephila pilipes]|uniref:Uncharacterized protein n=1 Tax=Nephila pilipes TaxID=299642 RepID=A0A8X6U4X1_NEPPI|nr:hypothetical protein NPIL_122001 [Nephila pilipes]